MNKVYLVVPFELDLECKIENFDLKYSKVFSDYDSAYDCLTSWIDDLLSQDDNLYCVQNDEEKYTVINHIQTAYGDDVDIPCYQFWFIEKDIETA